MLACGSNALAALAPEDMQNDPLILSRVEPPNYWSKMRCRSLCPLTFFFQLEFCYFMIILSWDNLSVKPIFSAMPLFLNLQWIKFFMILCGTWFISDRWLVGLVHPVMGSPWITVELGTFFAANRDIPSGKRLQKTMEHHHFIVG